MKAQKSILEVFRRNPHSVFSTSEIVKKTEPKKFETIKGELDNEFNDSERIKKAKRKKAKLHRKILYHLNKLVEKGILRVTKEGKKGEKYFALDIEEGEEIVIDKYKKGKSIHISKPQTPAIPIEGYEQKRIIHKLEPSTWIERLNSILIECPMFDSFKGLIHFITTCFSNINDTIALNNFESCLEDHEPNQIIKFIQKLNDRCSDYGKKVSCSLEVSNIREDSKVLELLKAYKKEKVKNISFIFECENKDIDAKPTFFEKLIKIFSGSELNLYIKNKKICSSPYILGRAGPYKFDENEWDDYKRELRGELKSVICSQATVMVDTDRFFEEESRNLDKFKEFNLKIAESLLVTNSIQRRRSEEFFNEIIKLNEMHVKDIFIFSRNYVRFWNYGWKREDFDPETLINLFTNSKKAVDKFCISEDTIYKSCGMPTRFRVAFSCAFEIFVKDIFSKAKYKKFQIKGIKDFYDEKIKKILEVKEKLFKVFDGGDLISFYRIGSLDPKDIVREILFVLNTYKLPFFRWNLKCIKESDMKLNEFLR